MHFWVDLLVHSIVLHAICALGLLLVTGIFLVSRARPTSTEQAVAAVVRQATGVVRIKANRSPVRVLLFAFCMACLPTGVLVIVESTLRGQGQSALGWSLLAISFLPRLVVTLARSRAGWVLESYRFGDYQQALDRVDTMLRLLPELDSFDHLRACILHYAGQLKDAEQALRKGLRRSSTGPKMTALRLEMLGQGLLLQERYTEAAAAFEGARRLQPEFGAAVNGLAELSLRRDQPGQALRLCEQAIAFKQKNPLAPTADRHELAGFYANRARALAQLGRFDEAVANVERAAKVGYESFLPGMARTLWRSGVALLTADRGDAASRNFARAAQIDPRGLYGSLAAKALRQQSVRV